jgi:hypothetical protein
MEIQELFFIGLPLITASGLSLLNGISLFKLFQQKEENTLLHIAIIFISACLVFVFFFFPLILPSSPPSVIQCFLIANVFVWLIFLEIGNAYFTAFLNCTNVIERYSLPIFGGTIGFSLFTMITQGNPLLTNPTIVEVTFYLLSFITVIYLLIMAYNRINLLLGHFEGEDLKLILYTQRLFWISAVFLLYTFISVSSWLMLKGIENLSLIISTWEIIDWLVYLNLVFYLFFLLGTYLYFKRIDYNKINIPSILNILDSPK